MLILKVLFAFQKILQYLINLNLYFLELDDFLKMLKTFVQDHDGDLEHVLIFEFPDGHQERAKLSRVLRSALDLDILHKIAQHPVVKHLEFYIQPMRSFAERPAWAS